MNLLRNVKGKLAGVAGRIGSRTVLRLWSVCVVAAKRLLAQRWLTLATALGLVSAVAVAVSIPLYADGVYYRVLRQKLTGDTGSGRRDRPPFAFKFHYVGGWKGAVEWEDVREADQYLSQQAGAALGLPQELGTRYFATDDCRLFPLQDAAYADVRDPLTWVKLGFVDDLDQHVDLLEGRFPAVADPSADAPVEVLVSEPLAFELGLQVGEPYIAFFRTEVDGGQRTVEIPVRVAGVWEARDPAEPFWFYAPDAFDQVMLVPEGSFLGRLSPYLDGEVDLAVWYLVLDGSEVYAEDVAALLTRIARVEQRVRSLLPYSTLALSPRDALQGYQRNVRELTVLLYAFSIPIVGLILTFLILVVGLSVGRQRGEIAVLRSRGATALQVVGIALLEGALVGVVALALGLLGGGVIARLIGRARSFLDFSLPLSLRVGVTQTTLRFGLIAVGLALLAQVVPTMGAARHTVVTYKQERARSMQRPWWQRAWLDVLLLIPAVYGTHLLREQGGIVASTEGGDPFQNPLLFLVPALGLFALTLFVLRVLPLFVSVVAWISSRLGGVGVLLAARHLSRTPGFYTAPVVLLVLTLSLSTFTASLAETLDGHLHDQMRYRVGADMRFVEMGEEGESPSAPSIWAGAAAAEEEEEEGPLWFFLPVAEHLKVPGVEAAARVGRYHASSSVGEGTQASVFVGVDWWDFTKVAFWREDFAAGSSLGDLMNRLGTHPDGVLVHSRFLGQHRLRVGDRIRLAVSTQGRAELDLTVVGAFDLFPGWYPEDQEGEYSPLFVGNLDYLFQQAGGRFPYNVWLNTEPGADYEQVAQGVEDLGLNVVSWEAPLLKVVEEQQRPARQGLFGVLSVGFLAAAVLTVLGFLLYAFFSFRRRFIELGILRAIGLSSGQMTAFLAWELAFLILTGLIAGTGLGAGFSATLIRYLLQVGTDPVDRFPPVMPTIAWSAMTRIYVLFGLLFLAALGGLAALLMRMKIFRAVKLGETT